MISSSLSIVDANASSSEINRALEDASASALAHLHASHAFMQAGDYEQAYREACLASAPDNIDCFLMQARALLALSRAAAAERILLRTSKAFPLHPEVWDLLSQASESCEHRDCALVAIDRAQALAPSVQLATHKGWLLLKAGRFDEAEELLEDTIVRYDDTGSAFRILLDVQKARGSWAQGAEVAARGCAAVPTDFGLWEGWAGCLLAAGRSAEAVEVTGAGLRLFSANNDERFHLLMHQAEGLQCLNKMDDAIEALSAAVSLQPKHEGAVESLCNLMRTKGRRAQIQPHLVNLRAMHALNLPRSMSDGLAAIWESADNVVFDEAALSWAWDLADQTAWEKAAWQRDALRGARATLLLKKWYEAAQPQQLRELEDLVDAPDTSALFTALVDRGSCFLASAHIGPSAAAVQYFARGNTPFHVVSSPDRGRLDSGILVPVTYNGVATMRRVVKMMSEDTTIAFMADEVQGYDRLATVFLGRQIELPSQFPKLLRKFKAPSFWCCPFWRNGRIEIELEQLPDACEGETNADWSQRWFRAYLAKLEVAMRGRPENLALRGGIWSNVNAAELHRRAAEKARRHVDAQQDNMEAAISK